jgi:myo-inositol-1(or 4)-monophosphatase
MQPRPAGYPHLETRITLEQYAIALARLAGEQICGELANAVDVEFKQPLTGTAANANPVSGTDRRVESLIRTRLAADFPDHAVIGEEYAPTHASDAPYTWVIDPVDGTTNYINGLPLFASAIGVLFRGRPVAGAIWCAVTHTLRAGVYHAHEGGRLFLDEKQIERRAPGAWRGLASEPGCAPTYGASWDTRVLGCATLEFAFVAAGQLSMAYIPRPALWDAAAGLALLHAADCQAVTPRSTRGETLLYFAGRDGDQSPASLASWSEPLLIGDAAALERARSAEASRS